MQKFSILESGKPASRVNKRVDSARSRQQVRFATVNKPHVLVNADVEPAEVQKFCVLDKESLAMIRMAVERMGLSARAYHRILKLSQTIANLAGSEQDQQAYLAEALQYRPRRTPFPP